MVKIRLARGGTNNRPFYHIVAAESRRPRDGRYLERLGTYTPKAADPKEKVIVNLIAVDKWLKTGAQTSETDGKLLKIARMN